MTLQTEKMPMRETAPSESGSLALYSVDADDAQQVRRLTRQVDRHLGPDAALALREFIANVREHCACKDVDVVELPSLLIAYDHGGGLHDGITIKPAGEGGYGLEIIRALGAEILSWREGAMLVMVLHAP
jgi:hypothetical protein